MEARYTCVPWVIGKIKKLLPWLEVKIRKILNILCLKRVKFEFFSIKKFAWVMGTLLASTGAHTYPNSGQVASLPPSHVTQNYLRPH